MSLAVCTLVKDEADRYLRSAASAWAEFADEIIAYDDHSSDETRDVLCDQRDQARVRILDSHDRAAWGAEWAARRVLFEQAIRSDHEWLLWLDADMVPLTDPRHLIHRDVDAIAFRLYDLWDANHYRDDDAWCAHDNPRIWMIRNPDRTDGWEWNERGLHCGHLPQNYNPNRTLVAPRSHSLLHYAYVDPTDRQRKRDAYLQHAHQLTYSEYFHALSITHDHPNLLPLPHRPQWPLTRHKPAALTAS